MSSSHEGTHSSAGIVYFVIWIIISKNNRVYSSIRILAMLRTRFDMFRMKMEFFPDSDKNMYVCIQFALHTDIHIFLCNVTDARRSQPSWKVKTRTPPYCVTFRTRKFLYVLLTVNVTLRACPFFVIYE